MINIVLTDVLTTRLIARINAKVTTTEGGQEGNVDADHEITKSLTDGSGSGKATGFFSSTFVATTGGVTISLADSDDPLGSAGSNTPTSDPEGLKLRAVLIENEDSTNFVKVKQGANGESSIIDGSTDSIRIDAGGLFLWTSPAGISAMTDGTDDELLFTSSTANVTVKLTYIFG